MALGVSVSTKLAMKRLKAWKVINDARPIAPDFSTTDEALDVACKAWLLETLEEGEVTTQTIYF